MSQGRIVCPVDREAMPQLWDAALNGFKVYVESAEANTRPTANAPAFNAAPQTALQGENKVAFPPSPRSMAVRSLNTMAASLALVFASSLPLNAQPKAPEVTVANPVVRRVAQWDEYTGQFEAVRRVEVRARVSGELVKIHFTDGQTVKAGDILFTIDPRPFEIAVEAARAEVARARAQVAVTGNDLERAEQLTPSKVLTQR